MMSCLYVNRNRTGRNQAVSLGVEALLAVCSLMETAAHTLVVTAAALTVLSHLRLGCAGCSRPGEAKDGG